MKITLTLGEGAYSPGALGPQHGDEKKKSSTEIVQEVIESLRSIAKQHPKNAAGSANNVLRRLKDNRDAATKLLRDGTFKRIAEMFKSKLHFDLMNAVENLGSGGTNTYLMGSGKRKTEALVPVQRRAKQHKQARQIQMVKEQKQRNRVEDRMDDSKPDNSKPGDGEITV